MVCLVPPSMASVQQACLPTAGNHLCSNTRLAVATLRHSKHICKASQRLPSIREFILNECPIRGIDGAFKEQAKAASLTTSVIGVEGAALAVPGERRLFDVTEEHLDRIIADQGRVLICPFEPSAGFPGPQLCTPKRGSWSCLGSVAGLQRLPGSSRALVRVSVTDRVAVQAVDCSNASVIKAQSAVLRDRWAYFVRTAALEQHLMVDTGSSTAGSEVTAAAEQVQDAAADLMQLMQQLAETVQAVIDSPTASHLQRLLGAREAGDELNDLLAWCRLETFREGQTQAGRGDSSNGEAGRVSSMPADATLLEKAWRLSFAPYAAKGLAAALFTSSSNYLQSPGKDIKAALEMTDLGLRLEAALDVAQLLRSNLAAQLALQQM